MFASSKVACEGRLVAWRMHEAGREILIGWISEKHQDWIHGCMQADSQLERYRYFGGGKEGERKGGEVEDWMLLRVSLLGCRCWGEERELILPSLALLSLCVSCSRSRARLVQASGHRNLKLDRLLHK